MTKWQNALESSPKMGSRAKLQLPTPPLPRGWVSGFLSADGNGEFVSFITKNGAMALTLQKHALGQNFQLLTYPKFGSPVFRVSTETTNLSHLL